MPKQVEVTAKLMGKKGTEQEGKPVAEFIGSCDHCFGETLEESMKLNPPEVINSCFIASAKITLQGTIRSALEKGMAPADVQEQVVNTYKPGVAAVRTSVDPAIATANRINAITNPAEKKKAIAELMALLQK